MVFAQPLQPARAFHLVETSKGSTAQPHTANRLLQQVIENFMDGILVLTEQGKLIQMNDSARRICTQLIQKEFQFHEVPKPILQICQVLVDSCRAVPYQPLLIESELVVDKATKLRVRSCRIESQDVAPYLLVILEEYSQSMRNRAIAEAKTFELTPREAEVWLLRRGGYTYDEIAAELYITLNTVKKHLKSVHSKRKTALGIEG